MNTMIEEIRKRIKARMDNTDAAGDYDEYADGQGVGLAAALRIIDEVEKDHTVPADVQEAAENSEIIFSTDGELTIYSFVGAPRWWATIREAEEALSVFKAGAEWQRERLMKEAVGCMFSFTEDKTPCLLIGDGHALRVNAKKGDYFEAIIIKKEK